MINYGSKTLKAFRKGEIQVLVSSDAMTRGMDVEGVRNVINYDMPTYTKSFIHRAGRTARAGQTGSCFTLLRKEEVCIVLLISTSTCISDQGLCFSSLSLLFLYFLRSSMSNCNLNGPLDQCQLVVSLSCKVDICFEFGTNLYIN